MATRRRRSGLSPEVRTLLVAVALVAGVVVASGIAIFALSRRTSAPNGDRPGALSGLLGDSPEPQQPPISVPCYPFIHEFGTNQIGANAKYKGKLVRVAFAVEQIGDNSNGSFLGGSDIGGLSKSAPTIICYLKDPKDPLALTLKQDRSACVVEGFCEGRVDDGISRGIPGRSYHVKLVKCKVINNNPSMDAIIKGP